MEIKEFLNARFLTPPILTIFFVFLANPEKVISFFQENHYLPNLILAPVFIFGLGFLISSLVTAFWIILKKKRITVTKKTIKELESFSFLKDKNGEYTDTALEMATWFAILDEKGKSLKYIREQLHKRWHAYNASINSMFGIIIAPFIRILIGIEFWTECPCWGSTWLIIVIFSLIAFSITAQDAYKSVTLIDNIMVRRYKKE